MTKLVKLSAGLYVGADNVARLEVSTYGNGLTVFTKSGTNHWVDNDYGKSSYETMDRLVKEFNND